MDKSSEIRHKTCDNCKHWLLPLPTSACNIYDDVSIIHDFKQNKEGEYYCDDWELNIPIQPKLDLD